MKHILIALTLTAIATSALAQQPFAPITLDAQKYNDIDQAIAKLAMPREAHVAWIQLWQSLERQAQQEAAKTPPPAPPKPSQ